MKENSWLATRPFLTLAAYLGKGILRLIVMTCRLEVKGLDLLISSVKKRKCILMVWHNRLLLVAEILNKYASQFTYTALISSSPDGEILNILAKSYPFGRTIRVPHRSKHHALKKMIHALTYRNDILIITPDGPKGPRYEIKPGILAAARKVPNYVIPFTWNSSHYWTFKTWDQLMIPKPFSKISIDFGTPISLEEYSGNRIENVSQLLKTSLTNLGAEA